MRLIVGVSICSFVGSMIGYIFFGDLYSIIHNGIMGGVGFATGYLLRGTEKTEIKKF